MCDHPAASDVSEQWSTICTRRHTLVELATEWVFLKTAEEMFEQHQYEKHPIVVCMSVPAAYCQTAVVVSTNEGPVLGITTNGINSFKGTFGLLVCH